MFSSFINHTNFVSWVLWLFKATPFGVWGWSWKGPRCLFLWWWGTMLILLGFFWPAGCLLVWWWLAWRGWHTGWRHQTTWQGMPPLLPGDTVSPLTGTAGPSCSPGWSPSPTSGRAISGWAVLCFLGSDGCPSEPQSPLCTCGVLPASPASVPRGSSSSAPQSSPTHGGPARFFPSGERCRGLAASGWSGGKLCPLNVVLSGPLAVLAVHLHSLSSCVC